MLSLLLVYVLAVTYITWVSLLNHNGPIPFKDKLVHWTEDTEAFYRQVNLFDYGRRIFKVYSVVKVGEQEFWTVKQSSGVWRCPYCLSFWLQLLIFPVLLTSDIDYYYTVLSLFVTPFLVGVMITFAELIIAAADCLEKTSDYIKLQHEMLAKYDARSTTTTTES